MARRTLGLFATLLLASGILAALLMPGRLPGFTPVALDDRALVGLQRRLRAGFSPASLQEHPCPRGGSSMSGRVARELVRQQGAGGVKDDVASETRSKSTL